MGNRDVFLTGGGLKYHGLPPVLYRDNGASQAVADYDADRLTSLDLQMRYKQRRKEGNVYGN